MFRMCFHIDFFVLLECFVIVRHETETLIYSDFALPPRVYSVQEQAPLKVAYFAKIYCHTAFQV
jgi:hypothetical protein